MTSTGLYAAACNPSRRAKQPRSETQILSQPQSILPRRLSTGPAMVEASDNNQIPAPTKRGRKPGTMSRSARETQRKLNHSIIEKARRTKINDALATLKQLIPADFGQSKAAGSSEQGEEGEDDEEYNEGSNKPKKAKAGKEEKEFKLEILVKTVAFMQSLLEKVAVLEASSSTEGACRDSLKRKRRFSDAGEGSRTKEARAEAEGPSESRLPSISSWLPNFAIDPALLPSSQLPSPPASTHFSPIHPFHTPPTLTLSPAAVGPVRTPEDESAASLLLQISSSSPVFPSNLRKTRPDTQLIPAQTPSSILGMK